MRVNAHACKHGVKQRLCVATSPCESHRGALHGSHLTGSCSSPALRLNKASRRCRGLTEQAVQAQPKGQSEKFKREKHKIFDQATILVRSGNGGDGELVEAGKGKWVRNFKYRPGAGMPKQIWLPASEPADGENGAHVIIVADAAVDSLLHLHEKKKWVAKKGANGNPAEGSGGPKRRARVVQSAPPLRVPVPPGTVVKDKKGKTLAELVQVGDAVCVCEGGRGGSGVVKPSGEKQTAKRSKQDRRLAEDGIELVEVEDDNWKLDAKGGPGCEAKVTLVLRVVADAGLVGLPNVGKSSLLTRMTRARAEVANYPFTTLMPNLGVMRVGGDPEYEIGGAQATLVDLPGLIEGAHEGRGLGRMFLRHLQRTAVLIHVVDAAAPDPAADYWVVREELRMYNPEYCSRPHVVALNKMDLPDAYELREELVHEINTMADNLEKEHPGVHTPPVAVHCCSAESGEGLQGLMETVAMLLDEDGADDAGTDVEDVFDWDTSLPESDEDAEVDAAWNAPARL